MIVLLWLSQQLIPWGQPRFDQWFLCYAGFEIPFQILSNSCHSLTQYFQYPSLFFFSFFFLSFLSFLLSLFVFPLYQISNLSLLTLIPAVFPFVSTLPVVTSVDINWISSSQLFLVTSVSPCLWKLYLTHIYKTPFGKFGMAVFNQFWFYFFLPILFPFWSLYIGNRLFRSRLSQVSSWYFSSYS